MNHELLLKIIFSNTTLLGIFILIAGSIKLFTYYKLFGIYIYEFVDIKEVIALFVNNLLAFIIVLIFISFTAVNNAANNLIIPISFTILSLLYFFIRKKVFFYEIIILNVLFWLFVAIVLSLFKNSQHNEIAYQNNLLLAFLISLVVYSIAIGFTEYYKVKYKKYYSKTSIYIDDFQFISNDDKYYIGKTERFLFIYDNLYNSTEAIPMSRVKKIVITI